MDSDSTLPCGPKRSRPLYDLDCTAPPLTQEEMDSVIAEAMAYQPPTVAQRVGEGIKIVAGLAFLIVLLWFAWPWLKPIIGISTIEHPKAKRERLAAEKENRDAVMQELLKIREGLAQESIAKNKQYEAWKTQAKDDPILEEALSIFDKLAADLREKHGITKARAAALIGGMSYEELLKEAEEMKPMLDVRVWDEYVKALAPEMREALWY